MEFKKMLLDTVAFTADTQDLNIPADHVKYLDIALCGAQCGSTACNWLQLPLTLDEVQLKLAGEQIVRIHFADLLAYQTYKVDSIAHMEPGAATTNLCHLMGSRLPLHVTKCGKSLSARFTWLTNANLMNALTQLTVAYVYREQPFPGHFNYQYLEGLSTAARQEFNLDYAGAELLGLLFWSTTVPTETSALRDIDKVIVKVDDREIVEESWLTMCRMHNDRGHGEVGDDAVMGGWFEHYNFLDFEQEPLPAGKLRVLTSGTATGHTIRLVPIYRQKNEP